MHGVDGLWEDKAKIRKMGMAMLTQLLLHLPVATAILAHEQHIDAVGVGRISAIRGLTEGSEERDYGHVGIGRVGSAAGGFGRGGQIEEGGYLLLGRAQPFPYQPVRNPPQTPKWRCVDPQ